MSFSSFYLYLKIQITFNVKNIFTLLDAYYEEFSDKDDVCLILKTSLKKPKYIFECDVVKEVLRAQKKHLKKRKKLPQVEVIKHTYENIIPFYNSCDCLVSATSSEGFGLPLLEGLAAGMLVVAPHVTGQADFLNENNSLKVDSREIIAPKNHQYWKPSVGSKTYMPDVESLMYCMRSAYENKSNLLKDFSPNIKSTLDEFTWRNAAQKIISIK